jgi:hypothetical protein
MRRTDPALTPRQLAAARCVVRGYSSSIVARALATTPRTINRWKALPAFRAELLRLHELLAVRDNRTEPPPPERKPIARRNPPHDDDLETEKWVNELASRRKAAS